MFHNILVAVDGSPDAEQALTQAIDLAESEHTRLTLITGIQQLPPIAYAGLSTAPMAQIDAGARSWAQAVLQHARDRVPDDLPVTTILTDRPIRGALIDQINRGRHDLVVMGSRGRGAIRAALLGSVSHYILNHSPSPVLIVHTQLTSKCADPNDATQPHSITTPAAAWQPRSTNSRGSIVPVDRARRSSDVWRPLANHPRRSRLRGGTARSMQTQLSGAVPANRSRSTAR